MKKNNDKKKIITSFIITLIILRNKCKSKYKMSFFQKNAYRKIKSLCAIINNGII